MPTLTPLPTIPLALSGWSVTELWPPPTSTLAPAPAPSAIAAEPPT